MENVFVFNSKMFISVLCFSLIILLNPAQTATQTANELLIADFNTGRDPINSGGKLQQWDHGKEFLEVRTGYHRLEDNDNQHGEYAAFVRIAEPGELPRGQWSGGGLVVVFRSDESAIDVSAYQFLEFDVKII